MKKGFLLFLAALLVFGTAVPALAVETVPSVEAKSAPEIVQVSDPDGRTADAVIIAADGTETYVYPHDTLELIITPLSGKEKAVLPEIKGMLIEAEQEVENAETVGDLTPDMESALEDYKKNHPDPLVQEVNLEDLCVTDIFDISLVFNGVLIYDVPDGCNVRVRLKTNLDPNKMYFVLSDCYGNGWNVVNSSCELDENGVLTLTRDALCPFIIIGYDKNRQDNPDDPGDDPGDEPGDEPGDKPGDNPDDKPHSPPTGEASELSGAAYLLCGLIFAAAGVLCLMNKRHRRSAED